jgi:hypothetical protein
MRYTVGMSAPTFIRLTPEEDARLRELENSPLVHPKVRLRALEIRLSAQGWTAPPKGAAEFVGRDRTTVLLDLGRWLERKFEGLADGGPLRGRRRRRLVQPQKSPLRLKLIFGNF